jgi:hypothetical protein
MQTKCEKHGTGVKIAVFWDVAPYSLVEIYRRFRGVYCLFHQGDDDDDGGSKHLWNVGEFLPDYTAQHPRRQSPLYSSPREPEISRYKQFQWAYQGKAYRRATY